MSVRLFKLYRIAALETELQEEQTKSKMLTDELLKSKTITDQLNAELTKERGMSWLRDFKNFFGNYGQRLWIFRQGFFLSVLVVSNHHF